jgi:glycosyltransferase involved in cell wall biosynthesis
MSHRGGLVVRLSLKPGAVTLPLSIFIIAKNEADRIGPVLDAVRDLTDDIVVIDSGSTDGTQSVAAACGARVVFNEWPGYGAQKRFGESQCRHDWMLNIDADEEVTPELAASIRALFAQGPPPPAGWRIRIVEMFPGEERPHRWAYGLSPVRLYHRGVGRYSLSSVHDRVEMAEGAPVNSLSGMIAHRSVRSLGEQLAKLNAYTDMQAEDMIARGEGITRLRMVLEFPANFVKAYIGRRHWLRGTYGFMTAMNHAFYRYLRAAKYWERRLDRRRRAND